MNPEPDWVKCEHEGDLHVSLDDPFGYGPQYNYKDTRSDFENDPAWTLTTHPQWGEEELWFYKCPGPHRLVWSGKEADDR